MFERTARGISPAALIVASLLLALSLASCGASQRAAGPTPTAIPTSAAAPIDGKSEHTVLYRMSGTASSAEVIYIGYTAVQGESRQAHVDLPWSKTLTARDGEFVYLAGQATLPQRALACEILVDGKTLKKAQTSPSNPVASCEALLGR